jgi:hypothetical protein
MHDALTLVNTIDPTLSSTQVAIYNKIVSNVPKLFFMPSNPGSPQSPIQLTYSSIRTGLQTTTPVVYYPTQYSFVAGPFIVYGGIIKAPTNGQVVTLTPGTTLLYVDLIATNNNFASSLVPAYAIPTSITGTSFTIKYQNPGAGTIDVYYFAIGA